MNYWWTSDYHFFHHNIIKYCNRPFKTVEEMNETIIAKHNERVKPDDTVFFLGDFIFKGGNEGGVHRYRLFEKRLNGKFIFIRGNHDNNNSLKTIITKMYLYYGAKTICMTHKRHCRASLFNYAVDNDWLVKSVVKKIKKLPEPESNSPDPLNNDEVIRVLDGCKQMDEDGKESINCFYAIMATIFYAGLRASEVTHLFPTDLDFKQGRILLRNKKIDYGDSDEFYRTKTKLHWFPPINDTLEIILKDWLKRREESKSPLLFPYIDGGPISVDYLFKKMKVIMERANFAPDRIARPLHRGRHTFASEATIAGVEEKYIQAALGHKTNAMTRKYVHLSPRFIADKFNKVSYGQNSKDKHNEKG